jgi:hypothetical protein
MSKAATNPPIALPRQGDRLVPAFERDRPCIPVEMPAPVASRKQKSLLPSRLFHTQSLTNKISWQKFF